jgi:hypothetical protein
MVLPPPGLGDYITFPAVPTNSVTIGWYQTRWTWREEEYYCAPCFTRAGGKGSTDFDIGCKSRRSTRSLLIQNLVGVFSY